MSKSLPELSIAPIAVADIPAVLALWRVCALTRPWNDPVSDIAMAMRGPNSTVLVGTDDGGLIAATAMVGHDGHRGWVYYVATNPETRGRGYGRVIMNAAEDWLRSIGIPKVQLMVRHENAYAGFYRSIGYSKAESTVFAKWLDGRDQPPPVIPEEQPVMTFDDRVRITDEHCLSYARYKLNNFTFMYRRNNGEWQTQTREVYDRGDAAALLPYNLAGRTVVLVRQFRLPAYLNRHDDLLIEVAAGMLDDAEPDVRIRAEAEEEIGYRLHDVKKVFEAFMSPGAVTEKIHCFVAEYDPSMRIGDGGGLADEGEDIEVLELPIDQALAMIADGRIADAKTIMLLQHAALHIFKS